MNSSKDNKERYKFFFRLFVLLTSILLSILGIELYLVSTNYPYQNCEKINQPSEVYLGQFDAKTGWSYKRLISYYEINKKYEYHFDEDGIRVAEPNYKIDYSKPRILFIGGSITFGEQLNYKDTFPVKINNLLGDRFEVINLGVQGFGTAQSMIKLKNIIEDISPKYVVFTFIPDHINRDSNYDRRLHVKCSEFFGTKPVFTVNSGKLRQIKKPKRYIDYDKFKSLLFLSMSYQNFREQNLSRSGENQNITKEIIREISDLSERNNAKDYYVYYETVYDKALNNKNNYLLNNMFASDKKKRVLNFTNWAEDSELAGLKYYVSEDDDYHPNASLSAEIARRFVEKFNDDFIE